MSRQSRQILDDDGAGRIVAAHPTVHSTALQSATFARIAWRPA